MSARRAAGLALADLAHERRLTMCWSFALAASLAPLLVLFGLKQGLIDEVARRLVESPRNLEIAPLSAGAFDEPFIARLAGLPGAAFAVPNTRAIAASFDMARVAASGRAARGLAILPSGAGDPLLGAARAPRGLGEVALSAGAAKRLGVVVGDEIVGRNARRRGGRRETAETPLRVVAILAEERLGLAAALVDPVLLRAIEDYRDGYGVAALGWAGAPPPTGPRRFARFRLMARSVHHVASLHAAVEALGIPARARSSEAAEFARLDRNLTLLFWGVAVAGGLGAATSLAGHLAASVTRKRHELSVLRLMGLSARAAAAFPVTQAFALAGLAGGLALLAAHVAGWLFAALIGGGGGAAGGVFRLSAGDGAAALGFALAAAGVAAGAAAMRAARIDPSGGLRRV